MLMEGGRAVSVSEGTNGRRVDLLEKYAVKFTLMSTNLMKIGKKFKKN